MTLRIDKRTWKRVALGEVIRHVTDRVDAETSGLERFLAGEHIPSRSLEIKEWGVIGRDPVGPMFYKRFQPGHVLYVSRRSYLRKTAVPEFEGITGEKTFVLETRDSSVLLQEFLPFLLSAEAFHSYAMANSRGSVNPYVNWTDLANYEFDRPSVDEQKRLADLLWAMERHRRAAITTAESARSVLSRLRSRFFDDGSSTIRAEEAFSITIGRQRSPKYEKGDYLVPYLRSANVTTGGVDIEDVKSMNFEPDEQLKFGLEVGDVLVSEGSASPGAVGMPAVWTGEIEGVVCFQNTLLRYRPIKGVTLPGFVEQWCRWAFESGQFLRASSGTNIYHIGVRGASAMRVRATGLEEQAEFVAKAAAVTDSAAVVARELDSVAEMRDAIVAQIFGGSQ